MIPVRVVLDTNVLASALMSPLGNPAKTYRMFLTGVISLVCSKDIVVEYEDVLYRPRLRIPVGDADMVLEAIRQHGELNNLAPSTFTMANEDDRLFLDVAKGAGACLITGNTRHYSEDSFVFTPTEFLKR